MLRQLMVSLLALGMLSSIARSWMFVDAKPRASVGSSTATAIEAIDELREASALSDQLTNEHEAQLQMMATRDQAIDDLSVPSKSLFEATVAFHGKVTAIYPRHFDYLRKSAIGENDLERLGAYLVRHIKYRASSIDEPRFDQRRAAQLETELASSSFCMACRKITNGGSKTDQP
jgi:uncharacterized protein YdbL (DUF1318 family)